VNRRQRTVVTGVHRLKHVDRFGAANLADDYAIWTHTECVLDEISLRYLAFAFDVGWACFQAHDVRLLHLQLGRVFDRDNAFIGRNLCRERV
jgi:hypothetical protein